MNINMKLTSVEVKAEVRELRCKYTTEMSNDIHSFGGLDSDRYVKILFRRAFRKNTIINIFNITT